MQLKMKLGVMEKKQVDLMKQLEDSKKGQEDRIKALKTSSDFQVNCSLISA